METKVDVINLDRGVSAMENMNYGCILHICNVEQSIHGYQGKGEVF